MWSLPGTFSCPITTLRVHCISRCIVALSQRKIDGRGLVLGARVASAGVALVLDADGVPVDVGVAGVPRGIGDAHQLVDAPVAADQEVRAGIGVGVDEPVQRRGARRLGIVDDHVADQAVVTGLGRPVVRRGRHNRAGIVGVKSGRDRRERGNARDSRPNPGGRGGARTRPAPAHGPRRRGPARRPPGPPRQAPSHPGRARRKGWGQQVKRGEAQPGGKVRRRAGRQRPALVCQRPQQRAGRRRKQYACAAPAPHRAGPRGAARRAERRAAQRTRGASPSRYASG